MMQYQKLSTLFYDTDKPGPPSTELAFYEQECQSSIGPIHEAMCGSGRFLIPLIQKGFDIDGSDLSPTMLQACRDKAGTQGIKASVFQQSLTNLTLDRKYGLLFVPSGSFSLITSIDDVKMSLCRVHDCLLPRGKFVVEVCRASMNESSSWPWGGRWIALPDARRLLISWMGHYDAETQISHSLNRYELIGVNGELLETEFEAFDLRQYHQEEFSNLLHEAGFIRVTLSNSATQEDDRELRFQCFKRE